MSTSVENEEDACGTRSFMSAAGDTVAADGVVDAQGTNRFQNLENNADGFNLTNFSAGPPVPGADNSDASLESLPLELLMHICSFLDAKFIINCLSHVSQRFEDILSVDSYWKARITKRWPKIYPPVPVENFDWKKASIEREEMYRIWSKPQLHFQYFNYSPGIFAPVDSVHILKDKRIYVSGSRDRYLNIVDVDKMEVGNPASVKNASLHCAVAHKGWIWSLTSLDDKLCTGSWDTYIKLWDLQAGCTQMSQFKCRSALLNLHMEPGLIMAGGYDKRIYLIDPREGKMRERRSHRQAVLCLAADDNYVITGSEDKTICVYDRHADAVLKTIPMESFPMSLSYGDNQLWVGDKQGLIHLYDTQNGDFSIVQTYDVGHKGKVTAIQHTMGAIFTCSTDKSIKVLEPSQNPGAITTLQGGGELAGIHYRNGVLVSAGSGTFVSVWRPEVADDDNFCDALENNQDQSYDHPESSLSEHSAEH